MASQLAEKHLLSSKKSEKHTSGAKAPIDSIGFMPGINPRPTARMCFSASCSVSLLAGANGIGQAASGAVQTPLNPPVPAATAATGPQAAAQPVTVPSKPAQAASQAGEPAAPALSS